MNTGWLFSSYYQACSDAFKMNTAQMGILLSVIDAGLCLFGICFYWTALVRYTTSFGPKELSGRASGLLFALSGAIMLVWGTVLPAVINKSDSVGGLKFLLISSVVILAITTVGQCIYDKEPWFGRGLKKAGPASDGFSFKKMGILFRNPRMWTVWLIAMLTATTFSALTYVQPLLAEYYNAPSLPLP